MHRDIKPANLVLTASGIKVIDFNISSKVGLEKGTLSHTPGISRQICWRSERSENGMCNQTCSRLESFPHRFSLATTRTQTGLSALTRIQKTRMIFRLACPTSLRLSCVERAPPMAKIASTLRVPCSTHFKLRASGGRPVAGEALPSRAVGSDREADLDRVVRDQRRASH